MPSTDLEAIFMEKLRHVFTEKAFNVQLSDYGRELTAMVFWGGKGYRRTVMIISGDTLATMTSMDNAVQRLREDVKFDLSLQRFDAAGRRPSGRRRHSDEMMRVTDYADAIST